MPNFKIDELEKNALKITFTVPLEEVKPYLEEAAKKISESVEIKGFRKGKASYDAVMQQVGEMKIYEEALEVIVRKTYVETIISENLDTVGSPKIDVVKLAPDNDVVYTAEVARMPRVTDLADYNNLSVDKKEVKVTDKDIELTMKDLTRMQTKEVRAEKDAVAGEKDKVVVSMDMKKEGVSVEGGQSPNHAIFMSEEYYIPGLKEQILGMKEEETKTFTLTFPKEHTQKSLAGTEVEFTVEVKEIFNLERPELNDAFAQSLGQKDLEGLKDILKKNIEQEKTQEEDARQEKEMLETLAKKSQFEEIPDLLLNQEIQKMIQELQQAVEQQGMEFDKYLENMKKSLAEMKMDFTPQAITRIKVALIIKEVATKEEVKVEEKELDEELDRLAEQYGQNEEVKKQIFSPQYRDYTEHILKNRKVIELLRKAMIKEKK